jgi:hypothetical protein
MSIDYIDNWYSRLKGRLYEQFKGLPKWDGLVRAIARQAQDWEDAAQAVLTTISIDDSAGTQLDNLGRLIGQPRVGLDDAAYRLYIKARIIANKSNGTAENIYRVFRALFSDVRFRYVYGGTKSFVMRVLSVLTPDQVVAARDFLRDSKEAGARAILEWQPVGDDPGVPTDNIMRWDVLGHGFDQAVWGAADQV